MTHFINPKLNDRVVQVVAGTILGGSSVVKPVGGKNCYLSMRSKDASWLYYKASELAVVSSYEPIVKEKTNRWHSLCYPIFNDMHRRFYNVDNKRSLDIQTLDEMKLIDVAFMIWYGDVGDYNGKHVVLNTHIWGESGSQAIVEYFKLLDWNSDVFCERKNFRVKLDENSSTDLIKMIGPLLPHNYKIKHFKR